LGFLGIGERIFGLSKICQGLRGEEGATELPARAEHRGERACIFSRNWIVYVLVDAFGPDGIHLCTLLAESIQLRYILPLAFKRLEEPGNLIVDLGDVHGFKQFNLHWSESLTRLRGIHQDQ
jgi:hypothetical protein